MQAAKKNLRARIAAWRDSTTAQWRATHSVAAWNRFLTLPQVQAARTIMLYSSFRSELGTEYAIARVLSEGRRLLLPRVDTATRQIHPVQVSGQADLVVGAYGIAEPAVSAPTVPIAEIDVVAVPGVVFDRTTRRIGYGAGYYDRFLPRLRPDALAVGVAFAGQLVTRVPYEQWDYRLLCLVTDEEVVWQPRRLPDRRYAVYAVEQTVCEQLDEAETKAFLDLLRKHASVTMINASAADVLEKLSAYGTTPSDCLMICTPNGAGVTVGLAIGAETMVLAPIGMAPNLAGMVPHFWLNDWKEWQP